MSWLIDFAADSLYDRAYNRMSELDFTPQEQAFIFADWPEGSEHLRWLLVASRDEIADWIAAGQA
jgi:hypothetical protein